MREIRSGQEPRELARRRESTPGFNYSSISGSLKSTIKSSLISEQRELCGYTGIRIAINTSHIEHIRPQKHFRDGEDVQYVNMLACYPGSESSYTGFGAVKKGSWPTPGELHLFVTPRGPCESRFTFELFGKVRPSNPSDSAAVETIEKLNLNHPDLVNRRKDRIQGTLRYTQVQKLDLKSARKRLQNLNAAEEGHAALEEFCFALKQVLSDYIARLEKTQMRT